MTFSTQPLTWRLRSAYITRLSYDVTLSTHPLAVTIQATVSGVSSIGSGSAMGGGLTAEQLAILNNLSSWWMLDEDGKLYTNKDTYSTGELSAYGVGTGGGGGGGGSLSLLSDVAIDSLVATNILQYDGTHWVNVAVSSLPGNATWGSATVNYSQLSVSGVTKSVSLNGHTHIIGDVDGLTAALSAKVDKVAGEVTNC